jgi:hypothetical protein
MVTLKNFFLVETKKKLLPKCRSLTHRYRHEQCQSANLSKTYRLTEEPSLGKEREREKVRGRKRERERENTQ